MSKTIPSLAYSPQEAGHPGRGKTYDRLYQDYTLVGMRMDMENYVSGCAGCQRTKASHMKPTWTSEDTPKERTEVSLALALAPVPGWCHVP